MVKSSYSSGHPALGVGAGNTPAIVDQTADIPMAVNSILLSKTFDNGVICASEQSVVVVDEVGRWLGAGRGLTPGGWGGEQ
jgi:acetaldehyde dehydrogenase/alcohol dehydrogenase